MFNKRCICWFKKGILVLYRVGTTIKLKQSNYIFIIKRCYFSA